MITPIRTMTISEIAERKDDLLVSADDIKEMAKNVRNKAIDEFVELICDRAYVSNDFLKIREGYLKEIAEQLKAGGNNE